VFWSVNFFFVSNFNHISDQSINNKNETKFKFAVCRLTNNDTEHKIFSFQPRDFLVLRGAYCLLKLFRRTSLDSRRGESAERVVLGHKIWFQHARVWFIHAECDVDTYECDYDTQESDYDTHTCQNHTLCVEITLVCDFHTHSVINTRTSVILNAKCDLFT
jgi:hypothetical protein